MNGRPRNNESLKFHLSNDSEIDRSYSGGMSQGGNSSEDEPFKASNSKSEAHHQNSKEAKWVRFSKVSVFAFLVTAATASAAATFIITSNAQQQNFETQFENFATEVVEVSIINSESIFSTIQNMGLTISSYALDTNQQWPFVIVPHFEQRGQQLLRLSGAQYLALNVLVDESEKLVWQNYSIANQNWIQAGLDVQGEGRKASEISPYIYKRDGFVVPDEGPADPYYAVTWQIAPAPAIPTLVNFNGMSGDFGQVVEQMDATKREVLSSVLENREDTYFFRPQSYLVQPIFQEVGSRNTTTSNRSLVGYLSVLLPWDNYFRNIIPEGTAPLHLVLKNSCGQVLTFEIVGPNVDLVSSREDLHDVAFDGLEISAHFHKHGDHHNDSGSADEPIDDIYFCVYDYSLYPSQEFYESHTTKQPLISTIGVVFIFVLTSMVFILYDVLVTKRQQKVEASAARSNAIVSSLFPAQVRDRLMQDDDEGSPAMKKMGRNNKAGRQDVNNGSAHTSQLSNKAKDVSNSAYDDDDDDVTAKLLRTKPIADLFPNATVLFADISGFTAWSSVREPTQVFTLLEQIYNSFDVIAKRRRIFKVETIGDCYVAAAGLPDPRPDHAVAMARFANECMSKMYAVLKKLEVRLGPGTSELSMRFGLHSGPVTAGVLRGEKSRFQLFGDTVNTASRIETTGERGRIHLSESTAQLLIESGKRAWVEKRDGMVSAKGKGDMVTYWLILYNTKGFHESTRDFSTTCSTLDASSAHSVISAGSISSTSSKKGKSHASVGASTMDDEKKQRLIDWNAEVLLNFLKKIAASRATDSDTSTSSAQSVVNETAVNVGPDGMTVLDEVKEIISLPQQEMIYQTDPQSIVLDPSIVSQVQDYVTMIASMYRPNSFHNFEHASHVTQSVSKLLSRIVKAEDIDYNDLQYKKKTNNAQLHQYTFGITSDPITQFACALSALIHDVDHAGVPNVQLVKEGAKMAKLYKNKSAAEQNSVELAWSLLMEKEFEDLRSLIYTTQKELERFRQLVVNSVMATDIADKELAQLRRLRWDKAFHSMEQDDEAPSLLTLLESSPSSRSMGESSTSTSNNNKTAEDTNRKATIVIEHLIQASDVSHTMQHWHVFINWNEKLFHEMYRAYKDGRAEKNPAEGWYQGELGFFDFYVIPLAKKLKECGVFGVASDEYLNYAEANRQEWERKGEKTVEKYMAMYDNDSGNSNSQ